VYAKLNFVLLRNTAIASKFLAEQAKLFLTLKIEAWR
jgi:hypothetical protein